MRLRLKPMAQLTGSLVSALILLPYTTSAQPYLDSSGRLSVVVVADPYSDTRTGPELVEGPGLLLEGGLPVLLEGMDCDLARVITVQMPPELEREYGEWNRASLTNKTLGRTISQSNEGEHFFIGLLSGSKSLVGMLAGLLCPRKKVEFVTGTHDRKAFGQVVKVVRG